MRHNGQEQSFAPGSRKEAGLRGAGLRVRGGGERSRSTARERRGLGEETPEPREAHTNAGARAYSRLLAKDTEGRATSFPPWPYQCFRVTVILSAYLGDFWATRSLSAVHPLLRCGPARLPVSAVPHPSGPSAPDHLGSLCHRPRLQPEVREVTPRAPFRRPPPQTYPSLPQCGQSPPCTFRHFRAGESGPIALWSRVSEHW